MTNDRLSGNDLPSDPENNIIDIDSMKFWNGLLDLGEELENDEVLQERFANDPKSVLTERNLDPVIETDASGNPVYYSDRVKTNSPDVLRESAKNLSENLKKNPGIDPRAIIISAVNAGAVANAVLAANALGVANANVAANANLGYQVNINYRNTIAFVESAVVASTVAYSSVYVVSGDGDDAGGSGGDTPGTGSGGTLDPGNGGGNPDDGDPEGLNDAPKMVYHSTDAGP